MPHEKNKTMRHMNIFLIVLSMAVISLRKKRQNLVFETKSTCGRCKEWAIVFQFQFRSYSSIIKDDFSVFSQAKINKLTVSVCFLLLSQTL